jgi:hypothetical protein
MASIAGKCPGRKGRNSSDAGPGRRPRRPFFVDPAVFGKAFWDQGQGSVGTFDSDGGRPPESTLRPEHPTNGGMQEEVLR